MILMQLGHKWGNKPSPYIKHDLVNFLIRVHSYLKLYVASLGFSQLHTVLDRLSLVIMKFIRLLTYQLILKSYSTLRQKKLKRLGHRDLTLLS